MIEVVEGLASSAGLPNRALKLKLQASNCIDVALKADNDAHAAELIDEAAKLAARAAEIAARLSRTAHQRSVEGALSVSPTSSSPS